MAITTLDELVTALCATTAVNGAFLKNFAPGAGAHFALFNAAGHPGAGATPSSGVAGDVPTDATAGALLSFTNPTAPVLTYLSRYSATYSAVGALMLYDRLWHNPGLSPTTLTAQTVNSVALTRPDANGAQVEAWFQVYATMGAGSTAPTITYTDQGGGSPNTGTLMNFATAQATGRTFPFQLAAGDTGVRSIQTYTNGATMTSGTFGLVLRRLIAFLASGTSNSGQLVDPLTGGLPDIPDDACLELIYIGSSSTSLCHGSVSLIQG